MGVAFQVFEQHRGAQHSAFEVKAVENLVILTFIMFTR